MREQKDVNKLTSIDEKGRRLGIIPADVRGIFRRRKQIIHAVLLFIFLVFPWLHWNGEQLILLNIPQREFVFLGIILRAHDTPLLFFLLATGTLGLAFVTAVWGRIWCGWACPQTVFIDTIYRRLETWAEGNFIERRKLQAASWTVQKLRKKILKWSLFTFVSLLIAHSFAAYFTGSIELLNMMRGSPTENWNYFLWIMFFTAIILFDFGWFREQFCVIMCPYGRIQSVLLEPTSLAVVYDQSRGEPRRNPSQKAEKAGDCVSCNRCVEVCPTGIDIRNGLQMECISCTGCIDACDEIMTKLHKPKGLIAYRTLDGSPFSLFKPKTFAYGFLIFLSLGALALNLNGREDLHVAVLRGIESPFTLSKDENGNELVLNHFRLHLTNQTRKPLTYKATLSDKNVSLTVAQNPLTIPQNSSETWHLFLSTPRSAFPKEGQLNVSLILKDEQGRETTYDLNMIGPRR